MLPDLNVVKIIIVVLNRSGERSQMRATLRVSKNKRNYQFWLASKFAFIQCPVH